ncbi:MAG: hypothetical protein ACK5W9_04120, partial [Bdellovibrionales bacterium]
MAFFLVKAWFSLTVVAVGALVINPLCIYLAKKNNPLLGRTLFVASDVPPRVGPPLIGLNLFKQLVFPSL